MIAHARETKDEKRVILAAYLNPFKTEPERNLKGSTAQLAMATIFASGGYHLLLGEEGSVLTEAYYPDNCRIGEHSFRKTLKKYYDFIKAALPINNGYGDQVMVPEEAELGNLMYLVERGGIPVSAEESMELKRYRKARNELAHMNLLSNEELCVILKAGKHKTASD